MQLDLNEINGELCKRKLSFFVKEFWEVVVPNDLVWNWHMDVLCDEYQAVMERVFKREHKLHDIIFNVPPGTSKTMLVSVMGTAWDFCRMPEIKDFVGSYSDSAVSGIADLIKIIMKSEKYQLYFPNVKIRKDKDSNHNFKTTENGEFYAFTIGGTLTSKHADVLKIDDPINPKKATSAVELSNANYFFDATLPTRKVDKRVTPTILIMQRLATDDPTGHILAKDKTVRHICLPGELSQYIKPIEYAQFYKNGVLDASRLDVKILMDLKRDLGSYGYAGQIMQQPAPEGGEVWQMWFIPIDDAKFPERKLMNQYGTDWDLAYTDDEDNAANAYVTAGKIGEYIYIDDIDWRWMEFPQLIAWMRTKPSPHYIEAKASGKSAKQTLTSNGIPAIEIKVASGDKVARARSVTPTAEAGMVFIRRSLIDKLYHDEKQGILQFPKSKYKDLADALAQCITRLKKRAGFISSSPTDMDQPVKNTSDRNLVDFM